MIKKENIKKGDVVHGFKVVDISNLKKQGIKYFELVHIATGAKYIHLQTEDKENTFCVAFKTLPEDSTGVAHILEHTVLMGSKKYPVRDPFFSMIKRSLNTFMNAFTACDWTAYPFSTQNKKDFYNLLSVYLDSAFFPEMSKLSFMQEGWRLDHEDGKLVYKGVVYNEMKGSMSSPDRVMEQSIMKTLYPNTTYRFNSGGDPKAIPQLTHKKLLEFHKRFYHPSNARFYSYGNLPLEGHLKFLNKEILDKFKKIDPKTKVKAEQKWSREKSALYKYPITKEEDKKNKYQIGMSWLMAPAKSTYEVFILDILEYILLGSQAAPLRKALLSSGLGSDLSDGSGFDSENRDTMFSVGLKDTKKEYGAKIKKTVLDTLSGLVKEGIDEKLIRAAIQKQEFGKREKSNVPYPHGLSLFLRIISTWLHEGNPLEVLKYEEQLKRLKRDLSRKKYLEKKIEKYFLKNKNRALIILEPDEKLQAEDEKQEKKKLKTLQNKLSAKEKARIKEEAEKLRKRQASRDDISVLPTLELSDVSPGLNNVKSREMGKDMYLFKQKTSGLFYTTLSLDVNNVKEDLLPLVPFFSFVLPKMGTKNKTYEDFSREIELVSGGLSFSASAQNKQDQSGDMIAMIIMNSKCLDKNIIKMTGLLKELFIERSFNNLPRLGELVKEYLARYEADMVQNGHQYASLLANRGFSSPHLLNEDWHGISQYLYLKKRILNGKKESIEKLSEDLERLAEVLFVQKNVKYALTGGTLGLKKGSVALKMLSSAFTQKKTKTEKKEKFRTNIYKEGWAIASAVSFSACAFESLPLDHKDSPVHAVISKILTMSYLLPELREKRGAYGGFAKFNPQSRIFGMGSYRDPHIISTINIFDNAFKYIRKEKFTDTDIKEAILSIVSEIDKPDTPAEAAKNAFRRHLIGLSEQTRLRFKQRLLLVDKDDVKRVADKYFQKKINDLSLVFLGNEQKLKEANKKLGNKKLTIKKIA